MEAALVLPAILVLSGLVLTAGLAFTAQALVQRSAEVVARHAAVPIDPALRSYPGTAQLQAAADDAAIVLDGVTVQPLTCDRNPCGPGSRIVVTVTYRWENPAARLLSLVAGQGASTAYDFTATAGRVRE